MMKVLLKNEWKVFVNSFRTMRRNHLFSYLIIFIVLGGFLFFITKGIWSFGPSVEESALEEILSYGFLMLFSSVFLLGVPQVFKDMYATKDLELLFTLPIQTRHVFWVKYLKSFVGVPLFTIIIIIIPAFTYGLTTKASMLFYPMVLFLLFLFTSIGLSIAYLFNLILVQIIPASRANELITTMSFLAGLLIYFFIMGPTLFSDKTMTEILLSGLPSLPDWVPTTWGSMTLIASANGSSDFILPFVLLLLLGALSIAFSTALTEKGFRTGWIRLSEGSKPKKKKRKAGRVYKVNHPIIAVGKNDWLAVRRDFREWLILMPIAIFFVIGLFSFFGSGADLGDIRGFNQISWPIAQAVMIFLYSITGGMTAASSIGREGAAYWRLETLPLSGRQIVLGKAWISWLQLFILLTTLEIGIGILLGWTIWQLVLGIALKGILTIGLITLGLWLGTIGAKYDPTNPQARLNFGVSILLFISSWVYLIITMIPFGYILVPTEAFDLPVDLEHGMTGFTGLLASIFLAFLSWKMSYPVLMMGVGIFVLTLISLGFSHLFTSLAARRIDKGITINVISESNSKPLFGRRKRKR